MHINVFVVDKATNKRQEKNNKLKPITTEVFMRLQKVAQIS